MLAPSSKVLPDKSGGPYRVELTNNVETASCSCATNYGAATCLMILRKSVISEALIFPPVIDTFANGA